MLGGSSAGLVFAIYYWLLSRQPKRLKAAYIALYDERNQYILRVTAVSTLIFMFLVNVIMIALYAFLGIAFSYVILLMIWLYCLLFRIFRLTNYFFKDFIMGEILMKKLVSFFKYLGLAVGVIFLEQLPVAFSKKKSAFLANTYADSSFFSGDFSNGFDC